MVENHKKKNTPQDSWNPISRFELHSSQIRYRLVLGSSSNGVQYNIMNQKSGKVVAYLEIVWRQSPE